MFVPKNHEVTMRCPVCFNRDIDVLMKHEAGDYSCLKCSYKGSRENVYESYAYLKKKFRWIDRRITMEDYEQL